MSKDNNNLRLLGSPVNLSYRGKKKDDKKNNIRNRPRSALQNTCFTPEHPERYKRPYSADTKDSRYHGQTTRSFLKTFSSDLDQSYLNSQLTVKVLAPTTDLLGEKDRKSVNIDSARAKRDLCSNASDYGSEDTYISLGTKIKAKAQSGSKPKNSNKQAFLKLRSLRRKNHKPMDSENSGKQNNEYEMEIKIIEKSPKSSPYRNRSDVFEDRDLSPSVRARAYEAYFLNLDERRRDEDALAGRVSFGSTAAQPNIDNAIDTYSRRVPLTKQQLSLVEEESTQDLESMPSHNLDSLSPVHSSGDHRKTSQVEEDELSPGRNTYRVDNKDDNYNKTLISETRTYNSFYDDFGTNNIDQYHSRLSSTVVHTDDSSKDSGYPESAANGKHYNTERCPPSTSVEKKSSSHNNLNVEAKSLESNSSNASNSDNYKTFPTDKKAQWTLEPLNHSRLLYKDFFLKKEGHIALPPQNSPTSSQDCDIPDFNINDKEVYRNVESKTDIEYPSYLLNSTTKAYTSKVIEDYKKEIEAINNLHELTIKDIKTDPISPTPLNLDKIFEGKSNAFKNVVVSSESSQESMSSEEFPKPKIDLDKLDVAKVSTAELIQNYLNVKESDFMPNNKNTKKKVNNCQPRTEIPRPNKIELNNKNIKSLGNKSPAPVNIRNPTQKTMFTLRTPLSARIDRVQNDRDVESWISLSSPSPRPVEVPEPSFDSLKKPAASTKVTETKKQDAKEVENKHEVSKQTERETVPRQDLNEKSTVLDIYSMLKEIESYADNPVTSVGRVEVPEGAQSVTVKEERPATPKDNFMEIFEFLEKVETSANDALSLVSSGAPQTTPKLEVLLKLPHTELAQRLVTASLQLEERSCCISLLQESLANHKEQMIQKVSNLEKQSNRNIARVKQECEDTIKRHQSFIDQLINDKKTLNHRIEQLVDERRSVEDRWKRSAQTLEERYKLELRNQHDKMAAAQQVARQRWVRQKAEKIKELTVKGLEGELRDMADRQQTEIAAIKLSHSEQLGKMQARHAQELEEIRRELLEEKERELMKERQLASSRMEKQLLELELSYQEQRTRLIAEMRAENDRVAADLGEREKMQRDDLERWREEQEKLLGQKRRQMEQEIELQRNKIEEQLAEKRQELEAQFEQYKKDFESEQQMLLKKKVTEISAQHKLERDREIEKAIESMDAEAQQGRKELQEALRRNKEQYELELKELAETEQATLRRYQDAQARVRQTEERCAELEVNVSQLETRNRILTEKNTQLESRAEEIRRECEDSWKSKMENLQKEMESMKSTHEEQMHQLYAKVKVAVARKDSAIQALTRETAKQQEKIVLLEQKLQQQRKDFLKQK